MLKLENQIVFSIEQFPRSHSSGMIWTAIQPSSFINIQYEETRPVLDLRLLPSPLVDAHSYRPKQLSVLQPANPSSRTLEATALLIAHYAARVGEAVTVHAVKSLEGTSGPLLVVGTFEEQPLRLLDSRVAVDEGIVSLTQRPGETFSPTLLVTGSTPKAVSRGVRKLIHGQFDEPGPLTRISQDEIIAPSQPRKWKGFMPPRNHFTLAEMGLKDVKFDSRNDLSVALPLVATPDTRFLDYGHQMRLAFGFNSDVGIESAHFEVGFNGSSLGRFQATEFSTGSRTSIRLKIPAHLLRRENMLSITWRGLDGAQGKDPEVRLLQSTEFDLPHDYQSTLPDLGLLQYGLYPFGLTSDFSDTLIVLPDKAGDEVIAALFEFAGLLGRLAPSDQLAFAVRHASELSQQDRLDSHMIVFQTGELPRGAAGGVQERPSSTNSDKWVLNVTSSSPTALHAVIRTIFAEGTLKQLRNDTAYIYNDRISSIKTISARPQYEYFYFTHLQAWLRENWIALPVILTTVSCLLFVGLRLALAQYKSSSRRGL